MSAEVPESLADSSVEHPTFESWHTPLTSEPPPEPPSAVLCAVASSSSSERSTDALSVSQSASVSATRPLLAEWGLRAGDDDDSTGDGVDHEALARWHAAALAQGDAAKAIANPNQRLIDQAQARLDTRPRKIAIVGYTPTRVHAPFDDPEWECWGMNNLHTAMDASKFDRWFDLHDAETIESDKPHVEWLQSGCGGMPVFVFRRRDEWPTSADFPTQYITDKFGNYFTNSVSWMLAMAIDQVQWAIGDGAEIGVFGVDMAQSGEYSSQRPSCEYFLGIAAGAGITTTIPNESDLLKTASMYGVENGGPLRARLLARDRELKAKMAECEAVLRQKEAELADINGQGWAIRGAIESNSYILNVWTMPEVKRDEHSQGQ